MLGVQVFPVFCRLSWNRQYRCQVLLKEAMFRKRNDMWHIEIPATETQKCQDDQRSPHDDAGLMQMLPGVMIAAIRPIKRQH